MTTIQADWSAAITLVVPPIAYILFQKPLSDKDLTYYEHFTSNSRVFPSGAARWLFPIVWTILFSLEGAAAFVFWRDVDTVTSFNKMIFTTFFVLYTVQLVVSFAWMNMFFKRRYPRWVSFLAILVIDAGVVGALGCSIIMGPVFPIVVFALLTAWLVYATIMTIVAAFFVPPYKDKKEYQYQPTPTAEPSSGVQALPSSLQAQVSQRQTYQHPQTRSQMSATPNRATKVVDVHALRMP